MHGQPDRALHSRCLASINLLLCSEEVLSFGVVSSAATLKAPTSSDVGRFFLLIFSLFEHL